MVLAPAGPSRSGRSSTRVDHEIEPACGSARRHLFAGGWVLFAFGRPSRVCPIGPYLHFCRDQFCLAGGDNLRAAPACPKPSRIGFFPRHARPSPGLRAAPRGRASPSKKATAPVVR